MLGTGLDDSRSRFCDLRTPPAAFITGKGDTRPQTHGATTLPPSPSHRLCRGTGQSTKLLANQLHSAPCAGWDPSSSPNKTKANPSSPPKTPPLHFLRRQRRIFHSLWQSPGLASHVFQRGGLTPVRRWTTLARKRQPAAQHLAPAAHFSSRTRARRHIGPPKANGGSARGSGVPREQEGQGHFFGGVLPPTLAACLNLEHFPLESQEAMQGTWGVTGRR